MASDRLDVLKTMLAQDPANTFARYGLAMEYVNRGQDNDALAEFEALLQANGDYAAAYYHGGRALERLQRLDEARSMFERGVDVTTRTGDQHTRAELQAALDMLGL